MLDAWVFWVKLNLLFLWESNTVEFRKRNQQSHQITLVLDIRHISTKNVTNRYNLEVSICKLMLTLKTKMPITNSQQKKITINFPDVFFLRIPTSFIQWEMLNISPVACFVFYFVINYQNYFEMFKKLISL